MPQANPMQAHQPTADQHQPTTFSPVGQPAITALPARLRLTLEALAQAARRHSMTAAEIDTAVNQILASRLNRHDPAAGGEALEEFATYRRGLATDPTQNQSRGAGPVWESPQAYIDDLGGDVTHGIKQMAGITRIQCDNCGRCATGRPVIGDPDGPKSTAHQVQLITVLNAVDFHPHARTTGERRRLCLGCRELIWGQ